MPGIGDRQANGGLTGPGLLSWRRAIHPDRVAIGVAGAALTFTRWDRGSSAVRFAAQGDQPRGGDRLHLPDLVRRVRLDERSLRAGFRFGSALFSDDTIAGPARRYEDLSSIAVANPGVRLSELAATWVSTSPFSTSRPWGTSSRPSPWSRNWSAEATA